MTSPQKVLLDECCGTSGLSENKVGETTGDRKMSSLTREESNLNGHRRQVKLCGELPQLALPDDWIALFHRSGGVVYLHKPTRVVTWSRPYCIGKASVKKHSVPVISIPCLHQMRTSSKLAATEDHVTQCKKRRFSALEGDAESNDDTSALQLLTTDQLHAYLSNIYEFEDNPTDSEPYQTEKHTMDNSQTAGLLVANIEALDAAKEPINVHGSVQSEWYALMEPDKSPVSVLNEYGQIILKACPSYNKAETKCGNNPYTVEAVIGGIVYGTGSGPSTKIAKRKAAEHALTVLSSDKFRYSGSKDPHLTDKHLEIFDKISITDLEVYELSHRLGLPTPAKILATCCERNKSVNLTQSNFKLTGNCKGKGDHEFEMTCGGFSVKGNCKSRKIGKQLGAQMLLKEIHPHISQWGSMLRLYGTKPLSETHTSELETASSSQSCVQQSGVSATPKLLTDGRNHDMLAILKTEMMKLAEKDAKEVNS